MSRETQSGTSHECCVVAVYPSFDAARRALHMLEDAHVPVENVSFVGHRGGDAEFGEQDVVKEQQDVPDEEALQYGDKTERTAAKGAGIGGLFGMLMGAPFVMVSGVGAILLAGPVATGLAGAIVGGFLGAMGGWGVHTDHVRRYEEKVADGDHLIIVHGDPLQVSEADETLQQTEADEVHVHAETSADTVEP